MRPRGRFTFKPADALWVEQYLVSASDDPSDPVVMFGGDGTVVTANAEDYVGRWFVLTMGLLSGGFTFTYVATRSKQNADALAYYYHSHVGVLTINADQTAAFTPHKRRVAA